jgi:hypothetical protein
MIKHYGVMESNLKVYLGPQDCILVLSMLTKTMMDMQDGLTISPMIQQKLPTLKKMLINPFLSEKFKTLSNSFKLIKIGNKEKKMALLAKKSCKLVVKA